MNVTILDKNLWQVGLASLPYNVKGNEYPKSPKEWCEYLKADAVWNLAAFNPASQKNIKNNCAGRTVHFLRIDGTDRGYGEVGTGTILNGVEIGTLLHLDTKNIISGYTVQSTGIDIVNNVTQRGLAANKTARNLHGITASGKYIIVQTEKATEGTACRYALQRAGKEGEVIKLLLTEDGGGSVAQYCRLTKQLYAPLKEGSDGRKVASVVYANYIGPEITRVLKRGCTGWDVAVLQVLLCVDADGNFGPTTEAALKSAQYRLGLVADGICGPNTNRTIFR